MIGAARNLNWRRLYAMATSGTGMVASTVIIMNLIRLGSTLVLTRLLDAEVYGVIGIVTMVGVTFGLITDLGFVAYVIRSKNSVDERFLDEMWTLRLIRSIVLTLLIAALSGPITAYMGKPELQLVIAISALSFLIEGLSSMGFATAIRSGLVARISIFDIAATSIQTVLTIMFAYLLRNYWAIICAMLLGGAIKILMSYTCFENTKRCWRFNKVRAIELGHFSKYIVGSSALSLILGQADKIVLSRFMPLEILGLYVIASSLAQMPSGFTSSYSEKILYPNYAHTVREQPELIGEVYYSARRKIGLLYAFAAGGMVTTAPLVVEILYDDRYRGAGKYLQLLSISAIFILNNQAANHVLISINRMWTTMIVNIVRISWLFFMGFVGYLNFGALGLVVAVGTMEVAAQIYNWIALRQVRLLDVRQELQLLLLAGAGISVGWGINSLGIYIIRS